MAKITKSTVNTPGAHKRYTGATVPGPEEWAKGCGDAAAELDKIAEARQPKDGETFAPLAQRKDINN
jgi:hypothetical protein